MRQLNTDLGQIKFRRDFSYDKAVPTFVSNCVSGADEIARWVLDRSDILYNDEPHAPGLCTDHVNKLTGANGTKNTPVLIKTDAMLYSTDSVVQYVDQQSEPSKRLLPDDAEKRRQVLELYNLFTNQFDDKVTKYVYSQMLADSSLAHAVFTKRAPSSEKMAFKSKFGSISAALKEELNLSAHPPDELLAFIRKTFQQVGDMLSDGRKYLVGSSITMADIAFASIAAPLILPEEFGGVCPGINQVPPAYRQVVTELRTTKAGQFVLDLYQEDRITHKSKSVIPKDPHVLGKLGEKIKNSLGKGRANLFYGLQKRFPVLKLGLLKLATVNRNDLLVEMMDRHQDFTVEEINSKKMSHQSGAFFLGWDVMNPQFDRERNFVRSATKRDDLELIRTFVRTQADDIIANSLDYGKLDVANTLDYPVLVRLIDFYFGVPAPTEATMKTWIRALFYDLFLNFTNNAGKHQQAVDAANERKDWTLELIEDRKQALKDGQTLPDNILNRMMLAAKNPSNEWVDDDVLQRNIGGLITGILETTNKSVIYVLDELFNRPEILKGAIKVAQDRDMDKMYGYVKEALRFNPVQPGVIRYCEQKQQLKGKGDKVYTIPAKTKVFAMTAAAMFDPAAFPDPKTFNPARDAVYMNYGYGLHECYGKYINAVTISELVAAVLRLKNVRRAAGKAGQGTGLHQGPFPTNFLVEFDHEDDE